MNSKKESAVFSSLSERDVITKYIIPAIENSGWNRQTQIREEVAFTAGRIFVKGKKTKRGERKRADIVIYYKANIPVAVVETKDGSHSVGAGMQQALEYAQTLDVPVAISSNGKGFVIQYRKNCGRLGSDGNPVVTENADLEHFPTIDELWNCYKKYNGLETKQAEETSLSSYFFDSEGRRPRYCQRIAINRPVEAIVRGTRVEEDYGKLYFTIIDFRNVTDKFADKDFDGAPVRIKEASQNDSLTEEMIDGVNQESQDGQTGRIDPVTGEKVRFENAYKIDGNLGTIEINEKNPGFGKKEKIYIRDVDVSILSERKQFLDANGKLVTCSLKEYTKNGILTSYRSLESFLKTWNDAQKKKAIIGDLENQGIIFEELKDEIKSDLDIFDLICHIAWGAPALTRKERTENVRKRNCWTKYGDTARKVLDALLDKYSETGIEEIEDMKILTIEPLKNFGTPAESRISLPH